MESNNCNSATDFDFKLKRATFMHFFENLYYWTMTLELFLTNKIESMFIVLYLHCSLFDKKNHSILKKSWSNNMAYNKMYVYCHIICLMHTL